MAGGIYIGHVDIPPGVAAKIAPRPITPAEVREACRNVIKAGWHDHPDHGRRVLLVGLTDRGRRLKVILHPVDSTDGTWRLRTALVAEKG